MRKAILTAILLVCSAGVALAQDEGAPAGGGRRALPAGPANPFAGNPDAVQQGMAVYNTNCTACHGVSGIGAELGSELVSGTRPDTAATDASIFKTVKNGVAGTTMPAWSGKLSDDDIWKVAAYIKGIRGNAIDAPVAGNVGHGQQVFTAQCSSCHTVNGQGGMTGPDLSNIASGRKVATIVDALTKPKHKLYSGGSAHIKSILPLNNYLPVKVTMRDGKVISGVLMNESSDAFEILGDDKSLHVIDRADVRKEDIQSTSLMPTNYDKKLTPVEFTDLLAYVTRLSTRPAKTVAAK